MDLLLLSLLIVAAVTLLVTQWLPIELTSLGVIVALPLLGLLEPAQAFSGFANEATITVAAMFVLSAGLARTGALDTVAALVTRLASGKPRGMLLLLAAVAAVPSAFLNNTPIVILLIPVTLALAQRFHLAPSKLMIPLSYLAILGGTLTLIGTSTNILVDSLYRQAGGPGFGIFEFTGMGLCYLAIGLVFLLLFGDRLLPERTVLSQLLPAEQRSNFVTEIVVLPESALIGLPLGGLLAGATDVRILERVRGEEVQLGPVATELIEGGDTLLVEGSPRAIHRLLQTQGLDLASAVEDTQRVKITRIDLLTVEAVVTPNSPYCDQRLPEIGLNRQFGIKVLAIQRLGRHHRMQLREMRLREGDVLLVQGEASALHGWQATGRVLLVEGVERTLTFPRKAPVAALIMALVVLGASTRMQPLSVLALLGAGLMVATGCLRFRQAVRSLESSVLLLLAGTLPLGLAMQETGLAELLAHGALGLANVGGPFVLLSAIYLLTSLLTAFVSNNATAVLLTPIALSLASSAGISPKPLLVAIAFGASASFATPIGYQTNLMVMGPGGYRFGDYVVIGVPLSVVLWIVASLLIPVFWPL